MTYNLTHLLKILRFWYPEKTCDSYSSTVFKSSKCLFYCLPYFLWQSGVKGMFITPSYISNCIWIAY